MSKELTKLIKEELCEYELDILVDALDGKREMLCNGLNTDVDGDTKEYIRMFDEMRKILGV